MKTFKPFYQKVPVLADFMVSSYDAGAGLEDEFEDNDDEGTVLEDEDSGENGGS